MAQKQGQKTIFFTG